MNDEKIYQEYIENPALIRSYLAVPDDTDLFVVSDEQSLLRLLSLLIILMDPDLIGGWDLDRYSIGYIVHRANLLDMDIMTDISRSQ